MSDVVVRQPQSRATMEKIFTRMLVRYGAAWVQQWEYTNIELVQIDWANELAGLPEASIMFALANLPADRPPATAIAFRDLCLRRPTPAARAEARGGKADPERAAAIKASLVKALARPMNTEWIERAKQPHTSLCAKHMAEAGSKTSAVPSMNMPLRPLSIDVLPPGMKADLLAGLITCSRVDRRSELRNE